MLWGLPALAVVGIPDCSFSSPWSAALLEELPWPLPFVVVFQYVFLWGRVIGEYPLPGMNSFASFFLAGYGRSWLYQPFLAPKFSDSELVWTVGNGHALGRPVFPFISACKSAGCSLNLSHSHGTSCFKKWQEAS